MTVKARISLYLLVFSSFTLGLWGCHSKTLPTVGAAKSPDSLTVALPQTVDVLDWNLDTELTSSIIAHNTMEGLTGLEISGSNVKVTPALAETWERSESGQDYTFHIRDKVQWSDGKELTAQDFSDSLERLLSEHSPWSEALFIIQGARSFYDGKLKFSETGIKVLDSKSLKISLREPADYFLSLMAHQSTFPIRKDLIAASKSWKKLDRLVTLGAFQVDKVESNHLVLKRNENYALKKPKMKTLSFYMGLKPSEAIDLYKGQELDAVVDLPPQEVKRIEKKSEIIYSSLLDVTYLTFNVKQKPLANPIFRRAVGMSIDRDELAQALAVPVKTLGDMVPPGLIGYESNRGVRFDPDAAKNLLKHSGYASMEKYDPFYLRVNLSGESKVAAENIQSQLKRALGVDVKIASQDSDLPKDARTIYLTHWAAHVPDPDNFLTLFTSSSPNNNTGWKNRNYDEFVRQAAEVRSREAREKLYAKAQHILTETEMPTVPLYLNVRFCLVNKKVRHFPLNALGVMAFRSVTVE